MRLIHLAGLAVLAASLSGCVIREDYGHGYGRDYHDGRDYEYHDRHEGWGDNYHCSPRRGNC